MPAKVTAPKTPAKRAAPRQQSIRDRLGPPPGPAAADPPGPLDAEVTAFEPVRLTPATEQAEKRVTLFYVGDKAYDIPAEPGMEIGLNANRILARLRMRGVPEAEIEGAVVDYIMETMLGEEGYGALRGFRGLKGADLEKIVAIAWRLTVGALEIPKASASG